MTAAAAEPKYISRLALQSNPFSAEVTEAGLYMGPEIKQRLDLVLHLLRASDKIPLLYGSNGLGKTTTLKALMNRGGDDLRFCLIQAEPSLTIQFMVSRCLQVFGAPQESTLGSNNLQLLQQRLQQLQTLQIRPVLLIDDISKLAEPLL
ncbi:AAA family ATPase, partial [Methylophaga sp. UBA4502]